MTYYGTDLSCTDDFPPAMPMSTGRRLIAEASVRRLITPLGQLRRHPLYGYDVRDEINDDLSPADLARISAGVNAQLLRDQRINQCTCTATLDTHGRLTLAIDLVDGAGPFPLVLSISDTTVSIVEGP